jgi:hypothetical protein
MRALTRPAGAALAALLMGTTAVHADVTAEEVWQSIVGYYSGIGQTLSTESKTMTGDTLVVSGVEVKGKDGDAQVSLRVPEMRFRETGDGRVEIAASEKISGRISGPRGAASAASTGVEITQTDLKVVVSGNAGDMTYDYAVPNLVVATAGAEAVGREVPLSFKVTLADGRGKTRMTGTATRVLDNDAAFGTMSFEVAKPAAKDGTGAMTTTGTLRNLRAVTGVHIPDGVDLNDMEKAIAAGYRLEARMQFASGNVSSDLKEASGTTNVQAGLADGRVTLSMSQAGVATELGTGPSRVVVQVPSLPVPAEVGLDGMTTKFALPVETAGAVGPFTIVQRLTGLTLSEGIWAMFDPGAALPHDPMTFVLDLSGTMKIADNIFADRPADKAGTLPAEVETLSLNELKLSAVGADIAGAGAGRIINGGAAPRPVGAADFEVKGLNALFDRLVAMQLVPQEQAMGMRMMMAMFTVPTGEDSAKSRIEADEAGDVRVNGQVLYKFPKP